MINLEKIGAKIATLRQQQNMKQNELAEALFVTHQAVSKWENGKSIPSIDIMYELTKLFNVSIDYLLEDVEIRPDDYETQLKNYPRASVISKFLRNADLDMDIEKIFYLLTKEERKQIIDLMVNKKISIQVESIWHVLSSKERMYLLGIILSNKYDYNLSTIYPKLSMEEEQLIRAKRSEGIYMYKLPHKKGGVIS